MVGKVENSNAIRQRCGVIYDVVTNMEKRILRWFGYLERMHEFDTG